MPGFQSESTDRLFKAIASLENEEEVAAFFSDLCTIKEIKDMSQRLDAAKMLAAGECYQKVASTVGISTATISRVSRCINYGDGGYQIVLKRLSEQKKQ